VPHPFTAKEVVGFWLVGFELGSLWSRGLGRGPSEAVRAAHYTMVIPSSAERIGAVSPVGDADLG
jgi:hypothetical protein